MIENFINAIENSNLWETFDEATKESIIDYINQKGSKVLEEMKKEWAERQTVSWSKENNIKVLWHGDTAIVFGDKEGEIVERQKTQNETVEMCLAIAYAKVKGKKIECSRDGGCTVLTRNENRFVPFYVLL